jgi:anti-sigma regulatory factor (Ser/Thr protein kinase)
MGNLQFSVAHSEDAPYEARCQLGDGLSGRTADSANEVARLLVSELVTNCILHSGMAPGAPIQVSSHIEDDTLRVEVRCEGPPFEHTPRRPPAGAPGRRGLYLVETLSDDWGVQPNGSSTAVWFQIACDGRTFF